MWRWCLNNVFQPYNYYMEIGGTDGTSINTNPPVYMCGVGMGGGGGGDIKRKGNTGRKERKKSCKKTEKEYIRTNLLGYCRRRLISIQTFFFFIRLTQNTIWRLVWLLKTQFSSPLSTNWLLGLFGPRSIRVLGKKFKFGPYINISRFWHVHTGISTK